MESLTAQDPVRIGPYRLIARLGAGGMGLVYLGRSEVGRTVAVKVVQAEYAAQAEFRKRFAREVAAARRVGGSWTADVLDADTGAEVPWVATQYVPGPDLATVVADDYGPLPESSVRVLANRLALALRAVHGAGLIHRDLKPSNVLVTVDGPRVIDFGIARAMDSLAGDSLHTRTGMLIGSPGFMSPEQVRGLELSPASDVFCLGAVLVYAATGRLLFGAAESGLNAHLFRVAEEEPELTGVPESLLGLVQACLHKDPAARPSPAQVADRTDGDGGGDTGGIWLPGEVLAQLGRRAAQLLDYAPAAREEDVQRAEPAPVPAEPAALPQPAPAAPGYTPTAPAHTPAPGPSPVPPPRRGWALVVLALAQTAVLLAMADLVGAGFGFGFSHEGPYLPTGDLLGPLINAGVDSPLGIAMVGSLPVVAFGSLLLPSGHLADRLGHRRALAVGLAGFSAAGLVGASPESLPLPVLMSALVLQGGFGAGVTATALSLVGTGFTGPKERTRAFGAYAAVSACGPVLGLLLSEILGWGLMSGVTAVLSLIALIVTLALPGMLPADAPERGGAPADLPGLLLGSLAAGALILGIAQVSFDLEADGWILGLLPGLVLLAGFGWRQATAAHPLLPRHVLRGRHQRWGLLAMFLTGTGVLGMVPPIVDRGRSFENLMTMLPMLAAIVIGATQVAPRVLRRTSAPRGLLIAGLLTALLGLALTFGDAAYRLPVPGVIITGLGTGLFLSPLLAAATAGLVPRHAGAVSAALLAAQFVGQGLGTALYFTYVHPPWWVAPCLLLAALAAARMTAPGADAAKD
ncbi:bifunctional serine/threonine protein kinase/MFS transporter [Streptomyces sp. NPDC018057]|uniref:bifunctional serine/threonine protein kinase/MFS transporter n=1 Tax=unclassified Streptomyces TaxID=2593676 RepID=UPI0037B42E53